MRAISGKDFIKMIGKKGWKLIRIKILYEEITFLRKKQA